MSTDPFGLLAEGHFQVTIVTSLPSTPVASSDVAWLKNPRTLAMVQTLLEQGVPLVTGKIPEGTNADAFVLPISYTLTQDVLKMTKDKVHKNILFLQAHATLDVVEHEFQHWQDYETGLFDKFMSDLQKLSLSTKLSDQERILVQDAVVEQRGHARQQLSLLTQGLAKNSVEVSGVASNYQPYVEALLPLLHRLEKKGPVPCKAIVDLLKKYELHTEGSMQFESFLPYWMKR